MRAPATLSNLPQPAARRVVGQWASRGGRRNMLQLAGAEPSNAGIIKRCRACRKSSRISAGVQCQLPRIGHRAGGLIHASRPSNGRESVTSLLFDVGAAADESHRVPAVSGTHDWVVPSGPEASVPMGREAATWAAAPSSCWPRRQLTSTCAPHWRRGGPLGGLLLAWDNAAFAQGLQRRGPNAALLGCRPMAGGNTYPF